LFSTRERVKNGVHGWLIPISLARINIGSGIIQIYLRSTIYDIASISLYYFFFFILPLVRRKYTGKHPESGVPFVWLRHASGIGYACPVYQFLRQDGG
jgi:hypothetical protein